MKDIVIKPTRTIKQNRAMHKLFAELADELNGRGLTVRKTLEPSVEIDWTATLIKEYIWKPIQKAQLGKESTTELTPHEVNLVFEVLARHLATRFGLELEFPDIESKMKERTK